MKQQTRLALYVVIPTLVLLVLSPYSTLANSRTTTTLTNNTQATTIITKLLANNLQSRLQQAGAIMEVTSKLPQMNNTSFAHLLLHGIPKNADLYKRQIAQDILSNYKDLQIIIFIMPHGAVYFAEPYSRQILTANNLAFRNYFQDALKTHNTYLGNVITSASTGQREALVAVPIYSQKNNSTLIGVWVGGIDIQILNKDLQLVNLPLNERAVYVDHNGVKIADSDLNKSNTHESFANFQSFKNAINGKAGTNMEEVVNGTTKAKMLVAYYPVKVFQNTWAVLLIQPL